MYAVASHGRQQLPICISNHATCPEIALQNMLRQKSSMTNTDCTRTDQDRETAELVSKPETANINKRSAKSPCERLIAYRTLRTSSTSSIVIAYDHIFTLMICSSMPAAFLTTSAASCHCFRHVQLTSLSGVRLVGFR
jgi:hypothetical protein